MSRKPFSEVTESYFRNEMREPLVRGHDNRSAACLLANAAIAQDKEYALRRIREENHEGMIYYRERDEARAERDHFQNENTALREENERLKERLEKSESRRTHWDAVTLTNYEFTKTQLAEAVKEIERLKSELATR